MNEKHSKITKLKSHSCHCSQFVILWIFNRNKQQLLLEGRKKNSIDNKKKTLVLEQ